MTLDELEGRPTITVLEAAELLGIGKDAAYEAVKAGELPALRIGRRVLILTAPLLGMLGATNGNGVPKDAATNTTPSATITKLAGRSGG